jgi:putative transposase
LEAHKGLMARTARLVVPGYPHHVTQRGSRKQRVFFEEGDYSAYVTLLAKHKDEAGVDFWGYCLMPNHVHLIAVPSSERGLGWLLRIAHSQYAKFINARNDWQGHLWQARFYSVVMDESHALASLRYVELNPVRAGLCRHAADWPWSSAGAHLTGETDALLTRSALTDSVRNWGAFLSETEDCSQIERLRKLTRTGAPAGGSGFLKELEALTGRVLKRRPVGRPPKTN